MDTKRFNKPDYKNQIKAVRNYRREAQSLPQTKIAKLFYFLGLSTIPRKIAALFLAALIVYALFFSDFFRVNSLDISGADNALAIEIQNNFNAYKQGSFFLLPQNNIFFFNKANFEKYLLRENSAVSKVLSLKKKFPDQIALDLKPRRPSLLLRTGSGSYILNSDGTLAAYDEEIAASLLALDDSSDEQLQTGEQFFPDSQNDFLQYLLANFATKTALTINSLKMPGRAAKELAVITGQGVEVLFSLENDPKEYLRRLQLLLTQIGQDKINMLSYADMRFENNAYLCYKSEQCAAKNAAAETNDTDKKPGN